MKITGLLLCCVLLLPCGAQDSLMVREPLDTPYVYPWLDSVVLVVGRREEAARELPYAVTAVDAADISQAQLLTTADALSQLGGVYVQKSQFGGGSPVVRGFEANRVLLVVDGVRMNNAIYRSGHLQNAITVDPLALDRLEVIFGAGSLAYGSDAIGGVIHFRTVRPAYRARTQDAVSGRWSATFGTAARALAVSGRLAYGAKNWAGITLLSTTATGHLRAGARRPARFPDFGRRDSFVIGDRVVSNSTPNRQIGTAYTQYNLLQKLRFRISDLVELDANFQLSTTSDVPRYDALTERRDGQLRWARWDYGPQTRLLASLRLQDRRPTAMYDVATYLVSQQYVAEDRFRRRLGDPLEENSLVGVLTSNLQTDFAKGWNRFTLRYGADLRYDAVNSAAFLRNVADPGAAVPGLASRYPSQGSSLFGGGGYLDGAISLNKQWLLRGGIRYSWQRLAATFGVGDPVAWPQTFLDGITNREGALTGALGLLRNAPRSNWRLLLAQGFRAPNLDDFAKFRERNGLVLIPNPDLQPERSLTLEAGYRVTTANRAVTLELGVYHTWLRQAIVRRNGTLPDGNDFFLNRGDSLFVQTNVNAVSARVYGADVALRWQLAPAWTWSCAAHALRGRRQQFAPDGNRLELPQDHIPPPYGSTAVTYAKGPWTANLNLRFQLAKAVADYAVSSITGSATTGYSFDRTGTPDNLELTPFISESNRFAGTYGWWTLNLRAEYLLADKWLFRAKIDNAADRHYRTFASGVSAPGIDVGLGVERRF